MGEMKFLGPSDRVQSYKYLLAKNAHNWYIHLTDEAAIVIISIAFLRSKELSIRENIEALLEMTLPKKSASEAGSYLMSECGICYTFALKSLAATISSDDSRGSSNEAGVPFSTVKSFFILQLFFKKKCFPQKISNVHSNRRRNCCKCLRKHVAIRAAVVSTTARASPAGCKQCHPPEYPSELSSAPAPTASRRSQCAGVNR
jgi:hypothetical protein